MKRTVWVIESRSDVPGSQYQEWSFTDCMRTRGEARRRVAWFKSVDGHRWKYRIIPFSAEVQE